MYVYVVGEWLVNIYFRENWGRKDVVNIYAVKGEKMAIAWL